MNHFNLQLYIRLVNKKITSTPQCLVFGAYMEMSFQVRQGFRVKTTHTK